MTSRTLAEQRKFWADDFDMDLLKVFPGISKLLHDPERPLWTVGGTTHGRLNHPAVWNTHKELIAQWAADYGEDSDFFRTRVKGLPPTADELQFIDHGAFLWDERPNLIRDERGWFNVHGCVDDSALVECTWLEWLRDAWAHQFSTIILPWEQPLPAMQWPPFERIMDDLRGWRNQDVSSDRRAGLRWVMRCDYILNRITGNCGKVSDD